MKATYTSKMWRRAGVTQLTFHKQLKRENANARSGHKMSANQFDTYVTNVGVGLSLPAAMALNEYND